MTQEEKDLLLKDLCARLLYGVKLHIEYYDLQGDGQLKERDIELTHGNISYCFGRSHWSDFKPYLRPMSSMTEEEMKVFQAFHCVDMWHPYFYQQMCNLQNLENMFNWLNAHHFDYRDLIVKGLALEASEDMYKTE